MVDQLAALTVADLCDNYSTVSHQIDDTDDYSTIDDSTIDRSTIENSTIGYNEDDDSFIANSSLCKEHRSTIHMLNSLRREVVELARSDDRYSTPKPKKSLQDVTIDLSRPTELSSPLISPLLSRVTVSVTNNALIPCISNHKVTPHGSESYQRHIKNGDDSTFCSMDNSIEYEMNAMKEVAKDLQRELKAANLDTMFEAIERLGEGDDSVMKNLFGSENENASRESNSGDFVNKEKLYGCLFVRHQLFRNIGFFLRIIWNCSMNVKILIGSIVIGLMHRYIEYKSIETFDILVNETASEI